MKKGKIKIDKKILNKIEMLLFACFVLVVVVIFVLTRAPSAEKAQLLVEKQYNDTINTISKVITGTEWIEIGDECVEQGGYIFCKSMSQDMQKYSDLKKYIETVCTTSFTKELLKKQDLMYKDIDGALYILDVSRGKDIFYAGLNSIKIKEISSHTIKAEVVCNYYIDLETKNTYTMPFEYSMEKSWGSWKTSDFTLPY